MKKPVTFNKRVFYLSEVDVESISANAIMDYLMYGKPIYLTRNKDAINVDRVVEYLKSMNMGIPKDIKFVGITYLGKWVRVTIQW